MLLKTSKTLFLLDLQNNSLFEEEILSNKQTDRQTFNIQLLVCKDYHIFLLFSNKPTL